MWHCDKCGSDFEEPRWVDDGEDEDGNQYWDECCPVCGDFESIHEVIAPVLSRSDVKLTPEQVATLEKMGIIVTD